MRAVGSGREEKRAVNCCSREAFGTFAAAVWSVRARKDNRRGEATLEHSCSYTPFFCFLAPIVTPLLIALYSSLKRSFNLRR